MPVSELLTRITSKEISEWQAYYTLVGEHHEEQATRQRVAGKAEQNRGR